MSKKDQHFGQMGTAPQTNLYDTIQFMIRQQIADVRTNVPVKVVAVHGGGVDKPPTVDVQVVIKQMDGTGRVQSHGTIYGIPVTRQQFGNAAIIMDPKVGDIGHMSISDRDISELNKNEGKESKPGSHRRHNLADGVFQAGSTMHGVKPKRFIYANGNGGWDLEDDHGNKISTGSGGIKFTVGGVTYEFTSGGFCQTGGVMEHNGKSVGDTHVHVDVMPGTGTTGVPQ